MKILVESVVSQGKRGEAKQVTASRKLTLTMTN